jgi:glucose-6-phosphate isomerase
MPPGWGDYVANADPNSKLAFGAWCDRQYGFDYTQMRAHLGLAWFPLIASDGGLTWERNPNYSEHLHRNPESIQWVSDPAKLMT